MSGFQGLQSSSSSSSDDVEDGVIVEILLDGGGLFDSENDEEGRGNGWSVLGKRMNHGHVFDKAEARLEYDYFGSAGAPPRYTGEMFGMIFRVLRFVFNRVHDRLKPRDEFSRKTDAPGGEGIHPLQRIAGSFRVRD